MSIPNGHFCFHQLTNIEFIYSNFVASLETKIINTYNITDTLSTCSSAIISYISFFVCVDKFRIHIQIFDTFFKLHLFLFYLFSNDFAICSLD